MMDGYLIPQGSGGGKNPPSAPTEAPNTLRSRMTARILYLVSEGRIEGLVAGYKSIFLNDTAVEATDGSANLFVDVGMRLGDAVQDHMDGFPTAEASFAGPGLVRKADSPPIQSLDLTGRDRWSVTITVRSLYLVDGQNNVVPNSVAFRIEWRVGAGTWHTAWDSSIDGKTVSPYPKQFFFPATYNGVISVRVTRVSDDPADSKDASEFEWTSYSAITDQKLMYPGSAYFGIKFDAEKFPNGIPTATFEVNGIQCEVPTNYDPITRVYSGTWDGTFKRAWTDNPAWIFWTLATDPRWGAGTALSAGIVSPSAAYAAAASLVDRWTLYSISQYCDEQVPDGYGGTEPRYTFNAWINTADEAYRVLSALASCFRGMIYWGRGQIVPVIDRPTDPVKLVTPANVIDGLFRYEGTALRARHSIVRVRWRDPEQGYREAVEVVSDGALMAEVGIRYVDYEAIGCTKRSMARRMGRWVLYTERYESGTVSYTASADHADAMPGEVVLVQDPKLAGVEYSGRLLIGQTNPYQFEVDRPITFSSGISYWLRVVKADGSISASLPITNAPGTTQTVTTSAAPGGELLPEAVWIITASNLAPVPYRVLAVEEGDEQTYNVVALRHYPGKYGFIEEGLDLGDDPWTLYEDPFRPLTPPTNLGVEEYLTGVGSTALVRVVFSWSPALDNRIRGYEAQALQPGRVIQTAATQGASVTFPDLVPGEYTFQVRPAGQNGQVGAWVTTGTVTVDGFIDPPDPPSSLAISAGIRQMTMRWVRPFNANSRFLRTVEVWAASNGFNNDDDGVGDPAFDNLPAAPSSGAFTKVGESSGTSFTHTGLEPSHVWYYKLRSADVFGSFSSLVGPIGARTSYLIAADIRDGIINTAKFASNIAPVELITTLSTVLPDGAIAFNITDGKLYKRVGGAWVPLVNTDDLSGTITSTQIADGGITTPKLAANAVTAAKIAALTITANELAANSVIFGKVAAGAIRATEIYAGELRAYHLASDTIITETLQVANLIIGTEKIYPGSFSTAYGAGNYAGDILMDTGYPYAWTELCSLTINVASGEQGRVMVVCDDNVGSANGITLVAFSEPGGGGGGSGGSGGGE